MKCVTDKFENQSIWIAVCKQNEICGVDRLTCKLEKRQTLDVLQYMQNDILWENQSLLSYLKFKRLIEFERLFVKPEYRRQGMFFMLLWCYQKHHIWLEWTGFVQQLISTFNTFTKTLNAGNLIMGMVLRRIFFTFNRNTFRNVQIIWRK